MQHTQQNDAAIMHVCASSQEAVMGSSGPDRALLWASRLQRSIHSLKLVAFRRFHQQCPFLARQMPKMGMLALYSPSYCKAHTRTAPSARSCLQCHPLPFQGLTCSIASLTYAQVGAVLQHQGQTADLTCPAWLLMHSCIHQASCTTRPCIAYSIHEI